MESSGHKIFLCLLVLICRIKSSASQISLSPKEAIQRVANQEPGHGSLGCQQVEGSLRSLRCLLHPLHRVQGGCLAWSRHQFLLADWCREQTRVTAPGSMLMALLLWASYSSSGMPLQSKGLSEVVAHFPPPFPAHSPLLPCSVIRKSLTS